MADDKYQVSFSSELSNVEKILFNAIAFIEASFPLITSEDRFDLKLIFSELLCNAVIHGNKSNVNKNVYFSIDIKHDIVFGLIKDEGCGFDHTKLLAIENNNPLDLSESGRGVKLAYALADSMSFNNGGNEITFCKKVKANG